MLNRKFTIIILIVSTIIIILLTFGYSSYIKFKEYLNKPVSTIDEEVKIFIPENTSAKRIADILNENNVTINKFYFNIWVWHKKIGKKFKAGEYIINKNFSFREIINILLSGKSALHKFTIKEGDTLNDVIDALYNKKIINKEIFLMLVNDRDFIQKFNLSANSFEGFFFPDTYDIPKYLNEERIIKKIVGRFLEKNKNNMSLQSYPLNLSFYDVLKMASIIEKEAVVDSERAVIAGVYYNRLKKGIKLEADPTILYIIGHKEKLYYTDLEIESPYNTYKYPGLPPTPICNPGIKSIEAAIYPDTHNYLFFVSNQDGTHHFSETAHQHLIAKKNIEKNNR